ncbi:MAG: excinuclease ABC subunit UvrC [Oscillospiraceae bacterium]|nr:excinuclease ABC subunit UvrC [Oscillospiraceae bacterium]
MENIRLKILQEKAAGLPFLPGIYIMKDKNDNIIYVGKSKALRNRVSQYFSDHTRHDLKTQKMVENVVDFDYMMTDSDMEALTLENQLIKLHMPKFNIRLKDGKSYPYIKVTMNELYPRISVTRKRLADGAKYYGPYSAAGAAYTLVKTAQKAFKLASCDREFPKDIEKTRPCIFYQMNQCVGPCTGKVSSKEYKELYKDVLTFLRGSYTEIKTSLEENMEYAAENLMFESAAIYRDRINSLERLWSNQKVVGSPDTEQDIIALYTDDVCSCITIFYVRDGCVIDSEHHVFSAEQIINDENISAFLIYLYTKREYIPKIILLNIELSEEDDILLSEFLNKRVGYKVKLKTPERGELKALCSMVYDNAAQHAKHYKAEAEKDNKTLVKLASILSLEVVPERIEAFDISNMGSDNITAGMIVAENGKLKKSDYRTYKITSTDKQDDYSSMREIIERRLKNHSEILPDLILLDGGKGHVSTIKTLLEELQMPIPVFGMVKDEFHKTRGLTTEDEEISIAREQAVFQLIYKIQEEVHRFTITKMTNSRSKNVKKSALEKIDGIGAAKARELLKHFKTMANLKAAKKEELLEVRGISERNANEILEYFKK